VSFRRDLYYSYLGRIVARALSPFGYFEWSVLYNKDLTGPIKLYKARVPIEILEARESDLLELSKATPYHLIDLLRSRYQAGSKCLLAKIDGKLVGFNWYVYGQVYDEGYQIRLADGDIYCMDAMTFEPHRGLAIHTELLSRLLLDAKRQGFANAHTRASIINSSSWKTHLRLGWMRGPSTFLFRPKKIFARLAFSWPAVYPLFYAPAADKT